MISALLLRLPSLLINICILFPTISFLPLCLPRMSPFDSMTGTLNGSLSSSVVSGFQSGFPHFLKARQSLNSCSCSVRILMHAGQQACLTMTMDWLAIDICCVIEARIQDSSNVFRLTAPNISSRHFLRISGNEAGRAAGQRGLGIFLTTRPKRPF